MSENSSGAGHLTGRFHLITRSCLDALTDLGTQIAGFYTKYSSNDGITHTIMGRVERGILEAYETARNAIVGEGGYYLDREVEEAIEKMRIPGLKIQFGR